jgi:hypothetical protein
VQSTSSALEVAASWGTAGAGAERTFGQAFSHLLVQVCLQDDHSVPATSPVQVLVRPARCHHRWSATGHERLLSILYCTQTPSISCCAQLCLQYHHSVPSALRLHALQVLVRPARCHYNWRAAGHERLLCTKSSTQTEDLLICQALQCLSTKSIVLFCLPCPADTSRTSTMPLPLVCC